MSGHKWRRGESNPRPDKRLQQLLHVYFPFRIFVLAAARKQGHFEAYPSVFSHSLYLMTRTMNQPEK
jgi:hypothetical protein